MLRTMKHLLFFQIVISLMSCGKSVFVEEVKRYHFDIKPYTRSNYRIFRDLFQDFNDKVGEDVLVLVLQDGSSDMSRITMTKGLESRKSKIGFGGWQSDSSFNENCLRQPFKIIKKVYTMDLEFDEDFVKNRAQTDDKVARRELHTLFLHEVGHGFKLKHDPRRDAVMYEKVDSSKRDHRRFYRKVLDFLND